MGDLDPGALIGAALSAIENNLGDIAVPALIVAAAVTALYQAWKFARMFLNGWDSDDWRNYRFQGRKG